MEGECNAALRIQNTFLDFRPESVLETRPTRSNSWPTRSTMEETSDDSMEYLRQLIENTLDLPSTCQVVPKDAAPVAPSDAAQGWSCTCGHISSPTASFCVMCGSARTAILDEKQIGTTKQTTFATPVSQASTVDCLPSLGAKADYAASTIDSLPSMFCSRAGTLESLPDMAEDEDDLDDDIESPRCAGGRHDLRWGEVTTLMLCDLPCRVPIEHLLKAINSFGFQGTYDFVYMPTRIATKRSKKDVSNLGYAFVNFKKASDATRFASAFAGHAFAGVCSPKQTTVKPAVCQGYTANVALYRSTGKHQSNYLTFP
jgi:hypothetical protein